MNASQDQIDIGGLTQQEILNFSQSEYSQHLSKMPITDATRKYLQQIHQILSNQNTDQKQTPQTPLIVDQPRAKSRGKVKSSRSRDKNKKIESIMGSEQNKQYKIEEFKNIQLQQSAHILADGDRQTPLIGNIKRKTMNNGGSVNLTAPPQTQQQLQQKIIKKGQSMGGFDYGSSTSLKQGSQPQQIIEYLQQSQWTTQPKVINPAMQVAQNSQSSANNVKLNTQQMIQRFLQDRNNNSSGNSNNQTPQFQGKPITQFSHAQQTQNMVQPAQAENQLSFESYPDSNNNYKLQLSKQILQQQQKLMTGMLTTSSNTLPLKKVTKQNIAVANFVNESLPKKNQHIPLTAEQGVGIQRSATPVIEANDFCNQSANSSIINRVQKPQVSMMGGGGPKLKVTHQVPNSTSLDGNHTPDQVPRTSQYLREQYLTAATTSTGLSRHQEQLQTSSSINEEGSGVKSAKKKIQVKKQIVPTLNIANLNVPSNSQQSWQ